MRLLFFSTFTLYIFFIPISFIHLHHYNQEEKFVLIATSLKNAKAGPFFPFSRNLHLFPVKNIKLLWHIYLRQNQ